MKRKKKPKKENGERWLLTYSDLITLLMIFFVVLYASSNISAKKFEQLSTSMQQGFGNGGGEQVIGTPITPPISEGQGEPTPIISEEKKLENLKAEIDKHIAEENLGGSVTTAIEERGLVVSFKNEILFESGKANLKGGSKEDLLRVVKSISALPNLIRIEGHTDNVPIKTSEFTSNWQLSCIRAANVAQTIGDSKLIAPNRISALGYGEYRPIGDNATDIGRARNRRVDLVILNSKYNEIEKQK